MISALEKIGDGMEGRMHIWGDDSSKPFQEGILIWDLKNSEEAKQIVVFETEGLGTHRNFFTGGKFVYLAANMKGYKGNIFVALDISEQTRRREVSRCWVEGGEKSDRLNQLHGLPYVVGEQAYLPYGRAGFFILNISNITNPIKSAGLISEILEVLWGHTPICQFHR
jgi:hypothetical protein